MRLQRATLVLSAGLLLAVVCQLAAATPAHAATPEEAIRAVADQYVKASLAGDAAAIAALFSEDAVEMPPNAAAVRGRAAIQSHYEQQFAGGKLATFAIEHLDAHASGDTGYDVGTFRQTVEVGGGSPVADNGKYLVVLRREGGAWKIRYAIYNSDLPPPAPPAPAPASSN